MANQEVQLKNFKCGVASFVANYIAGILHPFDVIKTRFQSHDGKDSHQNIVPKYRSIYHAFKDIYLHQGFKGLFKGFYMSLLSQAVASALFFWLYEKRKQKWLKSGDAVMTAVTLSSLEAGVIVTIITQPFWVIKTRMLLNVNPLINERQNFYQKTKQIHRHYGMKGFMKGLSVNIVLAFLGISQMYFYEKSRIIYDRINIPQTVFSQKNFVCGGISKILSGLIMYPFTTIRTRLQQNQFLNQSKEEKYKGIWDITVKTVREEGVHGFYKGLSANILKGIPQRGLYFYFYELIKAKIFNIKQFQKQ